MHHLIPVILICVSLNCLTAQSNATFNLGWGTQAEKILCNNGKTMLITGDASPGLKTSKYIAKITNHNGSYALDGVAHVYDTILDYRFHEGLLNIITVVEFACDYSPNDTGFIQIDTATMNVVKTADPTKLTRTEGVFFASDSSLYIAGTPGNNSYTVDYTFTVTDTTLSYHYQIDHVNFLLGNEYIFTQDISGIYLIHRNRFFPGNYMNYIRYSSFSLPGPILASYEFAQDSILILTNGKLHKTDTSLQNLRSHNLPSHRSFVFSDSVYSLINNNTAFHYSIHNYNQITQDSLTGLPSRFKLIDFQFLKNDTLVISNSAGSQGLRELHIQSDFTVPPANTIPDISIDSVSIDTIVYLSPGHYNREALFRIWVTNKGNDNVDGFSLQYRDHPRYANCYNHQKRWVGKMIAPGSTIEIMQKIKYWNSAYPCFYANVPNNEVEVNISDNQYCTTASLGPKLYRKQKSQIQLFPIPAKEVLYLKMPEPAMGEIQVVDLTGNKCLFQNFSGEEVSINIKELPPGIYFVRIEEANGKGIVRRVLVQ